MRVISITAVYMNNVRFTMGVVKDYNPESERSVIHEDVIRTLIDNVHCRIAERRVRKIYVNHQIKYGGQTIERACMKYDGIHKIRYDRIAIINRVLFQPWLP